MSWADKVSSIRSAIDSATHMTRTGSKFDTAVDRLLSDLNV